MAVVEVYVGSVYLPDLGALTSLEIGHEDRAQNWHLDCVAIKLLNTNLLYQFPCSQWIGPGSPDKRMARSLPAITR